MIFREMLRECKNFKFETDDFFVKTLKNYRKGIINMTLTKLSNGIAEEINSIVQLVKIV